MMAFYINKLFFNCLIVCNAVLFSLFGNWIALGRQDQTFPANLGDIPEE
jgi:hypothetical protein